MAEPIVNQTLINSLNQTSTSSATKTTAKRNELGKDQFLQLLIAQLKNQDPMDPADGKQMAADMANFSQVEQLISINDKLDKANNGDMGSMASYLGREVVLGGDKVSVSASDGGRLKVNLMADASSVKVDLLNADGSVKETIDAGALKKGDNTIELKNLKNITEGEYKFKVTATGASGGAVSNKAEAAGIVSGFIPGADPKLLVGSKQISPSDIVRVGLA